MPGHAINWPAEKLKWPHLQDLNLQQTNSNDIEVLLGTDAFSLIVPREVREGPPGTPAAVRTRLGWVASDRLPDCRKHNEQIKKTHVNLVREVTEDKTHHRRSSLWEAEPVGKRRGESSQKRQNGAELGEDCGTPKHACSPTDSKKNSEMMDDTTTRKTTKQRFGGQLGARLHWVLLVIGWLAFLMTPLVVAVITNPQLECTTMRMLDGRQDLIGANKEFCTPNHYRVTYILDCGETNWPYNPNNDELATIDKTESEDIELYGMHLHCRPGFAPPFDCCTAQQLHLLHKVPLFGLGAVPQFGPDGEDGHIWRWLLMVKGKAATEHQLRSLGPHSMTSLKSWSVASSSHRLLADPEQRSRHDGLNVVATNVHYDLRMVLCGCVIRRRDRWGRRTPCKQMTTAACKAHLLWTSRSVTPLDLSEPTVRRRRSRATRLLGAGDRRKEEEDARDRMTLGRHQPPQLAARP